MITNNLVSDCLYQKIIPEIKPEIDSIFEQQLELTKKSKDIYAFEEMLHEKGFIDRLTDMPDKYVNILPEDLKESIINRFLNVVNHTNKTTFSKNDIVNYGEQENPKHQYFMKNVSRYIRSDNMFLGKESHYYYEIDNFMSSPNYYNSNERNINYIIKRCIYDVIFLYVEKELSPLVDDIIDDKIADIMEMDYMDERLRILHD